ncbi:hypothetical protein CcCBS67573_g06661 [Chytriomyces confervae]|uniref:Alpha/beta hydrolase fold-3 domain-containing protein n=1 Tax=Chytriomyces confervae TaxID=246404 RepID=A0A507F1C5_9FUNG|nr:hypothetical protein HDU80_002634 [Chytriomyces hyalinus]TPX70089.1 hypothetical protein CcCBS67573_g06661 [Chytriomyces confervae]
MSGEEGVPARTNTTKRHPGWTPLLNAGIQGLRSLIGAVNTHELQPETLSRLRSIADFGAVPTNPHVSIDKTYVPRVSTPPMIAALAPLGLQVEDTVGFLKAEWLTYHRSLFSMHSADHPAENGSNSVARPGERVILYLHGGAYCLCSRKTHRGITWKLAKYAECRVLSVDYRLAPEFVFPLALHDAISAYSFLVNPPANFNSHAYHPSQVVIMGDSAGGNLATALMLWLRDHGPQCGLAMPGGVGLLSPWLDLTQSMPSVVSNGQFDYLPDKVLGKILNENRGQYYTKDNSQLSHPLVSPLFSSEISERPTCPILIHVGEVERLRDENLAFFNNFSKSPIHLEMFDAMVHVFHMFNVIYPLADFALERLGSFAQRVTAPDFNPSKFGRSSVRVSSDTGFHISELTREQVHAYLSVSVSDIRKKQESAQPETDASARPARADGGTGQGARILGSDGGGSFVDSPAIMDSGPKFSVNESAEKARREAVSSSKADEATTVTSLEASVEGIHITSSSANTEIVRSEDNGNIAVEKAVSSELKRSTNGDSVQSLRSEAVDLKNSVPGTVTEQVPAQSKVDAKIGSLDFQ